MHRGIPLRALAENRSSRWAAVIAWMALIFFLSSRSRLPLMSLGWADALQDVAGHFVAYAVLAGLLAWALSCSGAAHPLWWSFALALLYGLSDEFHQSFVPGRHPDVLDILTDAAGAACMLLILKYRRRRHSRRSSPHLPPPR